jgi:hypothetical protein
MIPITLKSNILLTIDKIVKHNINFPLKKYFTETDLEQSADYYSTQLLGHSKFLEETYEEYIINQFYSCTTIETIDGKDYASHGHSNQLEVVIALIATKFKNPPRDTNHFLNKKVLLLQDLILSEEVPIFNKYFMEFVEPVALIATDYEYRDVSIIPFLYYYKDDVLLHEFITQHKYFTVVYKYNYLPVIRQPLLPAEQKKLNRLKEIEIQQDIKNQFEEYKPLLSDDQLFELFNDTITKPTKKKKNKSKISDTTSDTTINNISDTTSDTIISNMSDTTSDTTINNISGNISDTNINDISDNISDITSDTNINISFATNISKHSRSDIINYIYNLYYTSDNFKKQFIDWDKLHIFKSIHPDNYKTMRSDHFTAKFIKGNINSPVYHFYVNDYEIYNITCISELVI